MATYFIEFREKGKRRRLPAGATVAQALEVQRRKHAELEAVAFGIIVARPRTEDLPKPVLIDGLIDRYLDQMSSSSPSSANVMTDQKSPGRFICPNESRRFRVNTLKTN